MMIPAYQIGDIVNIKGTPFPFKIMDLVVFSFTVRYRVIQVDAVTFEIKSNDYGDEVLGGAVNQESIKSLIHRSGIEDIET